MQTRQGNAGWSLQGPPVSHRQHRLHLTAHFGACHYRELISPFICPQAAVGRVPGCWCAPFTQSQKGWERPQRGCLLLSESGAEGCTHTPMGRIPHYPWPGTAVHLCPRRSKGIPAWDHSVWDGASCLGCGWSGEVRE